jgi:hypothetical protein
MKLQRILAILVSAFIVWVICYVAKKVRGVNLRYGVVGLMVILLPNALNMFMYPADRGYFAMLYVITLVGAVLLIRDMPRLQGK